VTGLAAKRFRADGIRGGVPQLTPSWSASTAKGRRVGWRKKVRVVTRPDLLATLQRLAAIAVLRCGRRRPVYFELADRSADRSKASSLRGGSR